MKSYAVEASVHGRFYQEKERRYLKPFQYDIYKVAYSPAFRKLEYKSQVFSADSSDYARTGLTHCLESVQVAKMIGSGVGLNLDLIEAAVMAHNLGHAPFGAAGSVGLNAAVQCYGCEFDRSMQALRVVTLIEERNLDFKGLNLTYDAVDALIKCHGPVISKSTQLDNVLAAYCNWDFALDKHGSGESQVIALADSIVYCAHDLEDGFKCELLTIDRLLEAPFFGAAIRQLRNDYINANPSYLVFKAVHKFIAKMVKDVVTQTLHNIDHNKVTNSTDMTHGPIVAMSVDGLALLKEVKDFLQRNVYGHHVLERLSAISYSVNSKLFDFYFNNPRCLPEEWQTKISIAKSSQEAVLVVTDFVSGMTDRYASSEYRKYVLGGILV